MKYSELTVNATFNKIKATILQIIFSNKKSPSGLLYFQN